MTTIEDIAPHLQWVSIGDVDFISDLSEDPPDAHLFIIEVLSNKLKRTDISLSDIESLSDDDLATISVDWLQHDTELAEKLGGAPTLEEIVQIFLDLAEKTNREMAEVSASFSHNLLPLSTQVDFLASSMAASIHEEQWRGIASLELQQINTLNQNIASLTNMTALYQTQEIAKSFGVVDAMQIQSTALQSIQAQLIDISTPNSLFLASSQALNSILGATVDQFDIIKSAGVASASIEAVRNVFRDDTLSASVLLGAAQSTILAQGALARIAETNWIGDLSGQQKLIRGFGETATQLTRSYSDYMVSLETNPVFLREVTPQLIRVPALELFSTSDVAEVITVIPLEDNFTQEKRAKRREINEENEVIVRQLLSEVETKLVTMLDGANQALSSKNPDRLRHFSISLRELFTQLIHTLAEDKDVFAWDPSCEVDNQKHPTRKSRLLYICRRVNHGPLNDYFKKDIAATLELVGVFNEGTHGLDPNLSIEQALAIKLKMEGAIRFMLEMSRFNAQ